MPRRPPRLPPMMAEFDDDEREAVLERFYRGRRSLDTPGSGLGLSIVCAIARLHDFRLRLSDAQPGLRAVLECWPATG